MRKRNIVKTADTIFWYFLYMLPVICFVLYLFGLVRGENQVDIQSLNFTNFVVTTFGIETNNVVINPLLDIFAEDGLIPFVNGYGIFYCIGWFVFVYLIHLMVDFILFIPRLAHKWIDAFARSED